jgi:hypothetical protein
MYDEYKINWVKVHVFPVVSPSNSGVVNNPQAVVSLACDVTGQIVAPTVAQIGAFDNYKAHMLGSGAEMVYTFSPKAINALQAGNLAINRNDWIILSAAGIAVAHQSLLMNIKTTLAAAVVSFSYYTEINFSVKQAS